MCQPTGRFHMGRTMELHGRVPSCLGTGPWQRTKVSLPDSFARVLAVLRERDNRKLITALHLGCIVLSPSKLIRHFTLHVKRRLNKDLWENLAHSSAKGQASTALLLPSHSSALVLRGSTGIDTGRLGLCFQGRNLISLSPKWSDVVLPPMTLARHAPRTLGQNWLSNETFCYLNLVHLLLRAIILLLLL